MLTEICNYLNNWFDRGQPKFFGELSIDDSGIQMTNGKDLGLQEDQYYRVIGSVFNDGVHKYGSEDFTPERPFDGSVWLMAVPPDIISIDEEIEAWQAKYGGVDSPNMSPYSSESFAGYSYTKAQGYAATGGGMLTSWDAVFAPRLLRYKKL